MTSPVTALALRPTAAALMGGSLSRMAGAAGASSACGVGAGGVGMFRPASSSVVVAASSSSSMAAFSSSSSQSYHYYTSSSASSIVRRHQLRPRSSSAPGSVAGYRRTLDPSALRAISPPFSSSSARFSSSSSAPSSDDDDVLVSGDDMLASFGTDRSFEGINVSGAMRALAYADAVAFDVDSTVIMEEGIDVLAASLGKGEEVSAWTKKAMEGNTKFDEALSARLSIMKPSRESILKCLDEHPLRFSPGIERLIDILSERGTSVYLVSGGFRIMIEPLARKLCVGRDRIYANTILFHEAGDDDEDGKVEGEYAGFDSSELTSRDMGKPAALSKIKESGGYDTVVMVGDGATDMQARPPADAFVGYGGVAVRDAVRDGACWFVTDFKDVIEVLERFGTRKKDMGGR